LGYDKVTGTGGDYVLPEFNGNISGNTWRSKGDNELRRFDFAYDNVNRITGADFNQFTASTFNKTANVDFSVSGLDYDANGNILHMNQKGLKINSSSFIDQLAYNYYNSSNKLLNVIDASNDATTKLGDFRASALYQSQVPNKTSSTNDYTYDVNGNMVKDFNKDIGTSSTNGIAYNYLNLPKQIEVSNKGSIEYVYDAGGNKLKKIVHETNKPDKTTTYINGFVYEDDVLQFCPQEEGRIRFKPAVGSGQSGSFVFDYFLKDHLGNVRMVLTEEQQTDNYPPASMEDATASLEETYYANLPATRVGVPINYPSNTPSGNQKVARVCGGTGTGDNKIGPAIVLKVMAGDKFNVIVNSWYAMYSVSPQSPNNVQSALIDALNNGVGNMAGGKATSGQLSTANAFLPGVTQFLSNQNGGNNSSKPKAFLNWLLFDEQFNLVSSNSGFDQIGNDQEYKTHVKNDMPVSKNGFLYIYVSNETPNVNVFFDNLQVTHTRGQILEETHYYPFGLTMAGISARAAGGVENKKKYNGIEFDNDLEIESYDAFFRNLDVQTGKWWQVDPRVDAGYESFSPYASMYDDPERYSDPLGDEGGEDSHKGGFFSDVVDGFVNKAVGTWNAVTSPVQTIKHAFSADALKTNIANAATMGMYSDFKEAASSGSVGEYVGGKLFEAAVTVATDGVFKGVGNLVKSSTAKAVTSAAESTASTEVKTYGELRAAGEKDAHHIIQDAAVRDVPGYSRSKAPAVQVDGPANVKGTPHYSATQVQRQAGGGTYGAERRIAYKALRVAGMSSTQAKDLVRGADKYFKTLGLNLESLLRTPGNRK
jgi:RHS repeat-associated protein